MQLIYQLSRKTNPVTNRPCYGHGDFWRCLLFAFHPKNFDLARGTKLILAQMGKLINLGISVIMVK